MPEIIENISSKHVIC